MGCGLPVGTGSGINCPKESPRYGDDVRASIEKIVGEHPDWRDANGIFKPGRPHDYIEAIAAELRSRGYCAANDRGVDEELALKRTNEFSEQWDPISSGMRPIAAYTATCRPASKDIPVSGPSVPPPPPPSPSPTPQPCPSPEPCHVETGPPGCETCAAIWAWMIGKGHWTRVPGRTDRVYNDVDNDPKRREYFDLQCNRRFNAVDGPITNRATDWFPNICRETTVCPSPAPCTSPTPEPNPGPSPAVCPAIVCLSTVVHHCLNAASQTVPEPVVGGKCHLDVTPLFSRCNSSGRCNAEQCNEEHAFCACGAWPNNRACESPDGYCWRKVSGPNVRWLVDDVEGGTKGWKATLDHLVPGTYVVESFTCDQRDPMGVPVPGSAVGRVTFEVR